eukprot:m.10746 g.10746  ORF g.10746 m.10746 type:complete len:107 (-) comp5614_c0_seq1:187-507(-)
MMKWLLRLHQLPLQVQKTKKTKSQSQIAQDQLGSSTHVHQREWCPMRMPSSFMFSVGFLQQLQTASVPSTSRLTFQMTEEIIGDLVLALTKTATYCMDFLTLCHPL